MAVTAWWQLKAEKFLGFGPHFELPQDEFQHMQNGDKPACLNGKLAYLLYPVYAMNISAYQMTFVKGDKWRKKMYKHFIKIVPTYNWAIQLLIDDPNGPTYDDVVSYKSMKGGRWSGVCNKWWNRRELRLWKEGDPYAEYNQLDVDYLRALWNLKYPELPI
jgi:hypothetical protein